ncbi:DUF3703 domain-containing protein [Marinobacter sp. JSM 1782161]|uniref:DUF3703 domain-containing protein n=1 Tax=Marinobacter sp. JSM 1782161 TaxID=2685906 RepID=UPI0014023DB6|nr:DUF3703 domain-containing protein [Marinobacter sp. JSM 1782161]
MKRTFTRAVAPFVRAELDQAREAENAGDPAQAFRYLERAHVVGQASTYWHVKVHGLMFLWALRQHAPGEAVGQVIRTVGAATKTALGLVPEGNTGGANVSPFRRMPVEPELAAMIRKARAGH